MAVIQVSKIQVRRGQELQTGIPRLDPGEFGWAEDTENLYIGKRIEEGAADDENTRVLTENDLNFFKSLLLNNTGTVAAAYEYRTGILPNTVVTSVQKKLDTVNPSLVDFGVESVVGTYVQIDAELQHAINDLFNSLDPSVRADRRRVLEIPAGQYYVSDIITLPPYTKLIGAGPGLTKIKYTNSLTSMFKTVDNSGNMFESGNMHLSTGSSRDIVIEGITFEFASSLTAATSLISLDNVNHALIKNCVFQTEFDSESTTTYGIVDHGIGIQIRGQGDNGTEKCRDVAIDQCEFNGLLIGVHGTGTVVTPSIRNSSFSNLNQGIVFKSVDTLQGPVNGYIAYNRFQDIINEGIYVGVNPNAMNSSHLSTQNYFARVGGTSLNEFTTASSTITSVINYASAGNKTVDDYFARKARAKDFVNTANFYYSPYVKGSTTLADSAVYTVNITTGTNKYAMIPLNGGNQVATVNYQLYNSNQSRKGTIVANITPSGDVAITDTYNYINTLKEDTTFITAATGSGPNVLILDSAANAKFAIVAISTGTWYLTGSAYPGKSAFITNVITSSTWFIVETESSSPTFDFSSVGTWTLLSSVTTEVAAYYDNSQSVSKNFISLTMENPSSSIGMTLDYQIDIQT